MAKVTLLPSGYILVSMLFRYHRTPRPWYPGADPSAGEDKVVTGTRTQFRRVFACSYRGHAVGPPAVLLHFLFNSLSLWLRLAFAGGSPHPTP